MVLIASGLSSPCADSLVINQAGLKLYSAFAGEGDGEYSCEHALKLSVRELAMILDSTWGEVNGEPYTIFT